MVHHTFFVFPQSSCYRAVLNREGLHLPAMPNRFITRMTVTWLQVSPPRGVGMLRLVNSIAISRSGRSTWPPEAQGGVKGDSE
jgi:hypothetical protein